MTLLTINPKREESVLKNQMSSCSICRNCQFYKFQERSGGYCHKLGVQVRIHWHSCRLVLPPFAPSWESGREIISDR